MRSMISGWKICWAMSMAKVVINPKNLPERTVPIPRSKEPVSSLPYKDIGHPEEVESFRALIREIRRQPATRTK